MPRKSGCRTCQMHPPDRERVHLSTWGVLRWPSSPRRTSFGTLSTLNSGRSKAERAITTASPPPSRADIPIPSRRLPPAAPHPTRPPRSGSRPRHSSSPRIHVRSPFPLAPPPFARPVLEQRGDPAAGVGGIDDVVDLAVLGHADPLAALVGGGHRGVKDALALLFVLDRLELPAHAQPHGSFEAHGPELGGRPPDRKQGRLETAAGHRLGAEPVPLAQH